MVSLPWIGKVPRRGGWDDLRLPALVLKSSFGKEASVFPPVAFGDIPPFKGGLSFQAAFGRQIVNLP